MKITKKTALKGLVLILYAIANILAFIGCCFSPITILLIAAIVVLLLNVYVCYKMIRDLIDALDDDINTSIDKV